ncbi:MAG: hypothetical protein GY832_30740 [Chloroflexi bacterium]|nr:hypothetical protein [Chloroflexota bacterium]
MTTIDSSNGISANTTNHSPRRIVAGLVLLLPASLCCITELLAPTLRTFLLSLQTGRLLQETEFVGIENYRRLFADPALSKVLGFTFSFVFVRLIVIAVVPLLLAWAVSRFGSILRLGVRVLLTVPVVLFMPVAIASVWSMTLSPGVGGPFSFAVPPLVDPASARRTLLLIDGLYTFGLACGLGLIFYLMIWRRSDESSPPDFSQTLKPLLVTWGIGVLSTIALTTSSFTLSFVMTMGGPMNSTLTLGLWQYQVAFQYSRFGYAAVLASLILLLSLFLGTLSGLMVILTRLYIIYSAASPPPSNDLDLEQNKAFPLIVLLFTLLLVFGACLLSVLPFGWAAQLSFQDGAFGQLMRHVSLSRTLVNTVIPPLLAAIVQLLIAYLGAVAIGAIRPLGKYSEWLLLPFSPWLFVTVVPLSLVNYIGAQEFGILDIFMGLIPPLLFNVPTLFILTLFFKGQVLRWKATRDADAPSQAGGFFEHMILPSLPLAGVMLLFLLFIGMQDLIWPWISVNNEVNRSLNTTLLVLRGQFVGNWGLLAAAVTLTALPTALFFFFVLMAFQLFYLDRLALRAGTEE